MLKIIEQVKKISTKQDYSPQEKIKDVKIVEIKRFVGEDGAFNEVVRAEKGKVTSPEEFKGFEIEQINHSVVVPGTVKAWHFHYFQDEIWFIHPEGKLIVGLLDIRKESPTTGKKMRLVLGDGKAYLLFIPRGVAHGLANPYSRPAAMTYLVNNWFDGSDEWRLPWNYQVEDDFWQIKKG